MKKILIPTDFSENSNDALDYAVALFKDIDACFYILNTYEQVVPLDYFDTSIATNIDLLQMLKKNSEEQLQKVKEKLEANMLKNGQVCQVISEMGNLTTVVKEWVEKEGIDVIVIGTKGETSSGNVVFGSNTIQIINKRLVPVLAVPGNYQFTQLKNILFPTDLYVDFADKHLSLVLEIAKHTKSIIHLLHKIFRGLNVTQRASKKALENYLSDAKTSFETIEDKEIDEAVYDYEQEHPTDLLVMINNKHSFLENLFFTPVVSKIVKETDIPFLVIPS